MAFPDFYNPDTVGTLYPPDTAAAIATGQDARLKPASQDTRRVILLLVDPQVDFIHPDGALYVPGAVEDTRRTIEWLYRNVEQVTAIAASLDSHTPIQIFYPTWWIGEDGQHPAPLTPITAEEVRAGHWRPLHEPEWSAQYVQQLEEQAKKVLMIWPYHTMIGTPGQAITPALYEAIAYHSGARDAQPTLLNKGYIAKTEHYSLLEPEVKVPEAPLGTLNIGFLDMLAHYDLIYVAGQAKSHCVLETVTSFMRYYEERANILSRMRFLMDCTSSVQHPEIDFEAMAQEAFANFEKQGMRSVLSTDPIG